MCNTGYAHMLSLTQCALSRMSEHQISFKRSGNMLINSIKLHLVICMYYFFLKNVLTLVIMFHYLKSILLE